MESMDDIRKKIGRLINERGLNYAQVSLAIGKNIAYLQQYDDSFDDNIVSDINYRKENISEKKDEYVKIDYEKKYTKVEFVRCPKCKSKVLKGSKFCMKCGEHIK